MIDGGREQQAFLAVLALVAGLAVPPRLAVAGDQVFRPIDPRDPAGLLDARNALAELPLAPARQDDLPLLGDRSHAARSYASASMISSSVAP